MKPTAIALVGDYSANVLAHRAIPRALTLAQEAVGRPVTWQWIHTQALRGHPGELAGFSGVWLAPASPYQNTAGALAAVRFARETGRPFLGTCGGFQHALLEFARNVLGLATADHAETNPQAATLVIAPLACSLVEKNGDVHFTPGSRLHAIYGGTRSREGYHCNYGFNPAHRTAFERGGFRFTAVDDAGEIRAGELPPTQHPFFVGTLFQPERAALRDETPPVVRAFVAAALQRAP